MDDEIKENIGSWEVPAVFPEPLWRGHYPGDLTALQEKTLEFLNNSEKLNTALEGGRGASSSSEHEMPHMWRESADFYAWLARPMEEIWTEWGFPKMPPRRISKSWANFHPPGAWTKEHTHNRTDQVAVLYLQAPMDCGHLQIMNPLFYHWENSPRGPRCSWVDVPIETGDVVIFPGWMLHRSGVNKSDEDRITININILASPDLIPIPEAHPVPGQS